MQIPRRPVHEPPDWGTVTDTKIPTPDGRNLEVWRIEPDGPSKGIVLLAHGWGRNRDRMINRARIFGKRGYTTVVHSARDHGGSTPHPMMNGGTFGEDIETVLDWIGEPVILYGHSAGAVGAALAARRRQDMVTMLCLEGSFAYTAPGLKALYYSTNHLFGFLFARMIIFWFIYLYRFPLHAASPALQAPHIQVPVLIIHGEEDQRFPVEFGKTLHAAFKPGQADLFIAPGADHSNSSYQEGYEEALDKFLTRRPKE